MVIIHPRETKEEALQLLLDGSRPEEVSEKLGVNKNTIIWWRTKNKRECGTEFPTHRRRNWVRNTNMANRAGFKYTDDEIILLAYQNPGFGIHPFVRKLYPSKKKAISNRIRYRITMLLTDYKKETGQDLYSVLQDPELSPQEFNWGSIESAESRPRHRGELTRSKS